MPRRQPHFRNKALAALLAALLGALGADRVYLDQRGWWLPLGITVGSLPLLFGVSNWYQTPPFFIAVAAVVAGFIRALWLALMPDDRFDRRFNSHTSRRNESGWDAVLVAVVSLAGGTIILLTAIALLFYTYFETTLRSSP